MMYGWGPGQDWWAVMAVSMVAFWAIVVFGIVALVRHRGRTDDSVVGASTDPHAILRARFAQGEIDEAEYRKRLAVLREKV